MVLPSVDKKKRSRTTHHTTKGKRGGPTPIKFTVAADVTMHNPPPALILQFTRKYPKAKWQVPQITIPLFWFDSVMVHKKLLIAIPPDIFIVGGRRFRAICQEYRRVGTRGRGYTRWLVYEERNELPDRGRP